AGPRRVRARGGGGAVAAPGPGRGVRPARLSLFGVGPTPVRASAAEQELAGREPTAERLRRAGELASEAVNPDADLHATAEYRRQVAGVLTRRALALAVERWTR